MNSLRRKIALGYLVIAALVVGLSAFSLLELRLVQNRIAAGEHVGALFNAALEVRRFEKNYFLYHQASDLQENRAYLATARTLLRDDPQLFAALATPERIASLSASLDDYDRLMDDYGRHADEAIAAAIRHGGKEILNEAESLARAERTALQSLLDRHRTLMIALVILVGLLVILIGQMLIRNLNRVLREMDLRRRQLMRAEKLAALGTLLSGVAHELNNPLSNISTSCEILAEEVGAGGTAQAPAESALAFQRELIGQIDAETWRARRIVRSLLDYARDRESRHEAFLLAPLIDDTLRLLRGRTPAEVNFSLDVPGDLGLCGDRQRLQQVFINLLGNAIEALEGAGTITLTASRQVAPVPPDALVFGNCPPSGIEISISDDGCGIAPDTLPRIFDPFFTTKDVGHGLGLGLFIVFEIIAEHGGCIVVSSQPNAGTVFRLRLPPEHS